MARDNPAGLSSRVSAGLQDIPVSACGCTAAAVWTATLGDNGGPCVFFKTAVDLSTVNPVKVSHENVLAQCAMSWLH